MKSFWDAIVVFGVWFITIVFACVIKGMARDLVRCGVIKKCNWASEHARYLFIASVLAVLAMSGPPWLDSSNVSEARNEFLFKAASPFFAASLILFIVGCAVALYEWWKGRKQKEDDP